MPKYEATFLLSGSELLVKGLKDLPPASSGCARLKGTDLDVEVEMENEGAAKTAATRIAEQFCDELSLRTGELFSAQYTQLVERKESRDRLAEAVLPMTWREVVYRPEDLPADVQAALDASTEADDILRKASAYFRHALFLNREAWRYVVPGSLHWQLFTAGALLHYHKAVSIIVGDPAIDHDHQSRYRRFGISDELFPKTRQLRDLRNEADVAHHALDSNALERARANIHFAKTTASAIVKAYAKYLRSRQ